jgi:polar amino acid transport system substrate-binding protein
LAFLAAPPADARSYAQIKEAGAIALCAHPNALPFAHKDGKRHGFQIELAEALAKRLGVTLERDWVITAYDIGRADCDIVMDSIADREAQEDSGLHLSKPYRRTAVALAIHAGDKRIATLDDLAGKKIGVLVSSFADMTLTQRGVETVPDLFESDLLDLLAQGEIDAAAVTPITVGYYNLTHPAAKLRLVDAFAGMPDLSWNVAVGMRRPDPALQQAIDQAITALVQDGTVKRIYARYGVAIQPPK